LCIDLGGKSGKTPRYLVDVRGACQPSGDVCPETLLPLARLAKATVSTGPARFRRVADAREGAPQALGGNNALDDFLPAQVEVRLGRSVTGDALRVHVVEVVV